MQEEIYTTQSQMTPVGVKTKYLGNAGELKEVLSVIKRKCTKDENMSLF